MNGGDALSQKGFPEWMVTKALGKYLSQQGQECQQRMDWLFGLQALTEDDHSPVSKPVSELCGFTWTGEQVQGGAELSFKDNDEDRGAMSRDEFRTYLGVTPDFRYWTKDHKQLIVEAKGGLKPIGRRDHDQAERYFMYLRQSGYGGAIIYFAPDHSKEWLALLTRVGGQTGFRFGVVNLDQVLPRLGNELLHVVAESLAQAADLLKAALRLPKD